MTTTLAEKLHVSQFEIEGMTRSLALYVKQSGVQFEQVVGIERGGLFVSRPLAAMLGLPHDSVHISCYTEEGKREVPIVEGCYNGDLKTLVVDDLIDGGSTIRLFKERFLYKFDDRVAVLYWRVGSPEPEYYVEEKPPRWICFPWEIDREN